MDRALLNRATKADNEPTPGYMYREIVLMTHASPVACFELEEYLLKKLQKDDPYVKLKVLRIIKHVCESGKSDFRRSIQRKADQIKAQTSYRGVSHVLVGDAPSRAVREEADACMKNIFGPDNQGAFSSSLESCGRIQGFGGGGLSGEKGSGDRSDRGLSGGGRFHESAFPMKGTGVSGEGAYGGIGSSTGRMQGFGNPNFDHSFKPTRSEVFAATFAGAAEAAYKYIPDSVMNSLANLGVSVPSTGGPPSNTLSRFPASSGFSSSFGGGRVGGSIGPSAGGGGWNAGYQGMDNWAAAGREGVRRPSGGDIGSSFGPRFSKQPSYGRNAGGVKQLNMLYGSAAGRNGWGTEAATAVPPQSTSDPGEYESRLVDEICAPGGARISPPIESLREFCAKCHTLDVDLIGTFLLDKLTGGSAGGGDVNRPSWQSQLRVLYIVEALLSPNVAPANVANAAKEFFSVSGGETLSHVGQAVPQCRLKVAKIMQSVGLTATSDSEETVRSKKVTRGRGAGARKSPRQRNLLDMGEDGDEARGEEDESGLAEGSDESEDEEEKTDKAKTTSACLLSLDDDEGKHQAAEEYSLIGQIRPKKPPDSVGRNPAAAGRGSLPGEPAVGADKRSPLDLLGELENWGGKQKEVPVVGGSEGVAASSRSSSVEAMGEVFGSLKVKQQVPAKGKSGSSTADSGALSLSSLLI